MTEPPPNAEIPEADLRQLAYDAAVACLASVTVVPRDLVSRNAVAWLAIHAAVDAILDARTTPDNPATSSDGADNSTLHDGPSVAECAADDKRWDLQKEGE